MGVRATRIILSAGGPTTYYVSAAGNDANDGRSLASPKRTIAGVNGLSLKAGDTVAFRGGDTFNDAVLAPKQGAAYTSYGTGKATLSPSGGSARIVDGLNVSDLVFSNLTLGGTTTGYGIFLQYTAGVNGDLRFSGIDTAGVAGRHLFVDVTSAAVSLGDIVIENSVFFDASGDNVVIAVDTATIASVTIENCISSDAEWQGMYVGGWPSPGKVGTMNVSDCTFSGNGYTGLNGYGLGGGLWERCVSLENGAEHGGGVGIFAWLSNNVTIRHCESFGNTSPDADGDGFDLEGCTDCVIEYCYSHDNKGAGFFMYDYSGSPGNLRNTFRYNISENDGSNTAYGGITLWAANGVTIQDARIYNNTVYSDIPGGSCLLLTNGPGLTGFIANNIFRASGTANQKGGSGGGSMTVDKNVWYGGVGSGYGTNKITTDPLLVDPGAGEDWGYLLQPGSPAAAAGVNIATTYSVSIGTTDYFGTPLGAPPLNLGCYGGITVTDLGIPASIYHTGTEYYPRNPWYIKAWEDGRLYLANGNTANFGPSPNSGCCILSYDPRTNTATNHLTCDDEMVMYFREIFGELYAPGCDLKPGAGTENYYRLRSGVWSKTTAVPFSDHNFDMCEFDGKIFACGGTSGTSVAAYSTDGGASFTNITTAFSRAYCLIPFNGDLYISGNAGGGYLFTPPYTFQSGLYLWKWDGSGFTKQSTNLAPGFTSMSDEFTVRRALEFSGKLLHITGAHLNDHATIPVGLFVCPTNLASASQVSLDTGEIPYDMIVHDGAAHLLTSKPNGSGAFTTRIRTSRDTTNWPVLFEFTTPSFCISFDILDGVFYIGVGTDMTGYTTPVADTGRLYQVAL